MADIMLGRSQSDIRGVIDYRLGREYLAQEITTTSTTAITRTFVNPSSTLMIWVENGTWEIKALSVYDKSNGKVLADMYPIPLNKGDSISMDRHVIQVSFTCTDASASNEGKLHYYVDGVGALE